MIKVVPGLATALVVACAIVLAGCGGSTDASAPSSTAVASRQAAAQPKGDTYSCPKRTPSWTQRSVIVNRLPSAVTLIASEYDCNDWDGTATPGHAFTGKVIQPGVAQEFTLQPVKYYERTWTMGFADAVTGGLYGSVRANLLRTVLWADYIRVIPTERSYAPPDMSCDINRLAPTTLPDTPFNQWPKYGTGTLALVAFRGHVTLASSCA